jgi:hypothetical protein
LYPILVSFPNWLVVGTIYIHIYSIAFVVYLDTKKLCSSLLRSH